MKPEIFKTHNQIFHGAKISRRAGIFFFVLAAIAPAAIYGKTPAEYGENIKAAKILTESLIYTDVEEMSAAERLDYERRALAEIRAAVPGNDKIDWQGAAVETNNRWLIEKLNEFEKEPENSARREAILTEVGERLEAIERKLNELENSTASNRAKDEDKQKLAEILRREEYLKPEKPEESLFQKAWRKIKEWLREMFPQPAATEPTEAPGFQTFSVALQAILYALVLGVAGFLIYRFAPFLAQKFKRREKKNKSERVILGERLDENETAENLFEEAERLARAGNPRGAIRKGYIALLCELSDRKIIAPARHKTNRDYLRDVRKDENLYENMNGLTVNFERHWYGSESVEEKDWNEFKNGYKRIITN
ncbi:MAG TPA: DUF4129 domain-containing protein [Pyrinomonadaceae bacterium]|nr:DUF4129 domain-containing protein [Pyrinomonadaceae bacterium]